MTVKEAIETIKVAISEVEWNYPMNYAAAFDIAIEALKKQLPKKPIGSGKIRCCEVWKCINCGFEWSSRVVDYCHGCGQKIKWSKEEEKKIDKKTVIEALRCSASVTPKCKGESCTYFGLEEISADLPVPPDIERDGKQYWTYCDVDRIALDAAELLCGE